jgi:hypothetical protein
MNFWGSYVLAYLMSQLLMSIDYYSSTSYMYYFIIHIFTSFIIASLRNVYTSDFWWHIFITFFFTLGTTSDHILSTILPTLQHILYGPSTYDPHDHLTYKTRAWKNPTMFPAKWCLLPYIMVTPYVCGFLHHTNTMPTPHKNHTLSA